MGKTLGHFIKLVYNVIGGTEKRKMDKALKDPLHTSAETLRRILTYNQYTVFSRQHDFEEILTAKTDEELITRFREKVQPCDYEDIRVYIDKQLEGYRNVITPGRPFMYATTSGTTAKPKFLPLTYRYRKVSKKISNLWFWLLSRYPQCIGNKFLIIVSPAIEAYTKDGIPVGSISGYTQASASKIMKKRIVNPYYLAEIADYTSRYYTMMRMAIEHKDVSGIITANPSTIVELLKNADEYYDEYVKDIENGTLSDKFEIEDDIRARLAPMLKRNPKRAAELRALKEQYGKPQPKHYWPMMTILNTWRCGNTGLYLEKLADAFPADVKKLEMGYFASECRFGTPMDESEWSVPLSQFHFIEFVEESEIGKENPKFLLPHELEEGKRYCAYVSTFNGLYRYNMNDLLIAGPKYQNTRTIHMVQKINGIVSITGEKLYEQQFIEAVHKAERAHALKTRFFAGFADVEKSRYDFFFEFEKPVDKNTAMRFTELVDNILQDFNTEYAAKRKSLRLKEPKTYRLTNDSYREYKKASLKKGMRDGQFKVVHLMQDKKKETIFKNLSRED